MDAEPEQTVESIPAFGAFRALVTETIGYFPEFHYDRTGLAGHRMRVFRTPPAADIRYSERALVRYICLADFITVAVSQTKSKFLVSGLCLIVGGDLLRQNRFAGLAFIERAFRDYHFARIGPRQVIDLVLRAAHKQGAWRPVISLLFPLAHEIGHLPQSQALCPPPAIHDDLIRERCSASYEHIRKFTGEFDYQASFLNSESPLNLTTLRQEAVSDYFAVTIMARLPMRCDSPGENYPLEKMVAGILTFPLVMGVDSMTRKLDAKSPEPQDITLAMHCRYSFIVDSIREATKAQFRGRENSDEIARQIDSAVDHHVSQHDQCHIIVWKAYEQFLILCHIFGQVSVNDIMQVLGESMAAASKCASIAEHLEMLVDDVNGYSIDTGNCSILREYSQAMKISVRSDTTGQMPS